MLQRIIRRIENGKEFDDIEFFLNGKSIAYATLQDDMNYYSVDICAVDENGEKITNGFVCPTIELTDHIFAAFPEWEKQYFANDVQPELETVFGKCVWCEEVYELSELKREKDMGFLCHSCIEAIRSRGEKLCIEE